MKYAIAIILLVMTIGDIDKIAKVNQLKKEAREAYLAGDYSTALGKYQYLLDSMGIKDDNITLNLANSYYNTKDTAQAINNYSSLLNSSNKLVRSTANQQLGVISTRNKKFKESLDYFKEALRADPTNEDARYNYEMMKKILKEQEQQQQQQNQQDQDNQNQQDQQQDQDQQQQDQQDKNEQDEQQNEQQQDKEGEGEEQENEQQEGEQQEKEENGEQQEQQQQEQQEGEESEEQKQEEEANSISEKLEEMKISEEKAKMILEALKNKEVQYLQQNKRKPTKRKDPKKPDW